MCDGSPHTQPAGLNKVGIEAVSKGIFDRVTTYHAQIGANVSQHVLQEIEARMLTDAKTLCEDERPEEALQVFTQALAVNDKAHSTPDPNLRAAIVHNIGYCLHSLGEFEAARAYYEEALDAFRKTPTPLLDRWTLGWVFGDLNASRVQFIKERLFDISLGRKPEHEYLDEWGRKRTMPHTKRGAALSEAELSERWAERAAEGGASGGARGGARPDPDDEHLPGYLRQTAGADGGMEEGSAAAADAGYEGDGRDDAEQEAARKQWLECAHIDPNSRDLSPPIPSHQYQ